MDLIETYLTGFVRLFFSLNFRVSIYYLAASVMIAFLVWIYQGRPKPFLSWLLPRKIYLHKSNLTDIKLFLTNRALSVLGLFSVFIFTPTIAFYTLAILTGVFREDFVQQPIDGARMAVATLVIVMVSDFCKYWSHRWQHTFKSLWPFHAVHHSADVLTPVTVLRVHPVENLIRNVIVSLVVGVVQGIVLFALIGKLSLVTIGGANAIYFLFNTAGSNLRHSHIWLSYGRVLEHIFISPAQHQVHHSVAIKHHDKNFGSIFALWDWMFGTLYIPPHKEDLKFGVSDENGQPIEQPHPTLRAAMIKPFVDSWGVLRSGRSSSEPSRSPATDP